MVNHNNDIKHSQLKLEDFCLRVSLEQHWQIPISAIATAIIAQGSEKFDPK
jgi:hypothetical protein